ncbi:MAG: nicotinate-nicotinamide nucleotide adenylyltransferase [Acholeplasmatales bacterium]|nr:nicotinate-nicotinamide nucleotide adenylyltransferase [Acholeplasmatales bacterium]
MVIVFGGSFNPITIGHKLIVEECIKKYQPEKIIILPTGNSYNKKDLVPFLDRYKMIEISFNGYSNVIISDIEKNVFKGTYHSLKTLSKTYKDIYFLFGADQLDNFSNWLNYNKLIKNFKFIIVKRGEIEIKINDNVKYDILDFNINTSSKSFRNTFDSSIIEEKVYNYIVERGLYKRSV